MQWRADKWVAASVFPPACLRKSTPVAATDTRSAAASRQTRRGQIRRGPSTAAFYSRALRISDFACFDNVEGRVCLAPGVVASLPVHP